MILSVVPCVLNDNVRELVPTAKILVVGAGGIGCEILKNLALSGFTDIEIIDLDTIDVSNLNRQFLFRKEHVGKPKAVAARESVLNYNPKLNIKAYHDSVTSQDYGVNYFKKFKVVLNALDNRAARNHVNRMCLADDVPLIESGTAGYSGQVESIKKGVTQCYECVPKGAQETFPGCTIRNTPSEPIHCIVWAKHLFKPEALLRELAYLQTILGRLNKPTIYARRDDGRIYGTYRYSPNNIGAFITAYLDEYDWDFTPSVEAMNNILQEYPPQNDVAPFVVNSCKRRNNIEGCPLPTKIRIYNK